MAADPPTPVDFDEVFREELELITARREAIRAEVAAAAGGAPPAPAPDACDQDRCGECARATPACDLPGPGGVCSLPGKEKALRLRALNRHMAGLALSGGGIRSATFALGVLQGLADLKLLGRFDYLSTVSGGGYIGGWLAAWIKREGSLLEVEKQLSPSRVTQAGAARAVIDPGQVVDEEPEPVRHLRSFSNYLTPTPGLLSADTWTLGTIYIRNALINMLILVPFAMLMVLAGRLVLWCFSQTESPFGLLSQDFFKGLALTVFVGCFVGAMFPLARSVFYVRSRDRSGGLDGWGYRTVFLKILGPLSLAAIVGSWSFSTGMCDTTARTADGGHAPIQLSRLPGLVSWALGFQDYKTDEIDLLLDSPGDFWLCAGLFGLAFGVSAAVAHGGVYLASYWKGAEILQGVATTGPRGRVTVPRWLAGLVLMAWSAGVAGFFGGMAFFVVTAQVLWPLHDHPEFVVTLGPPLFLLVFVASTFIEIWLVGRYQPDDLREWWARICAWLSILAFLWAAFFAITLCGPMALRWLTDLDVLGSTGVAAGWFATALGGAFAGRRGGEKAGGGIGAALLRAFLAVAPVVFVVGLFVLVAILVDGIVLENRPGDAPHSVAEYWGRLIDTKIGRILIAGVACGVFFGFAGVMSNVNLFSMNSMYANRLTRCYLGASRVKPGWGLRGGQWKPGMSGAPTGSRTEPRFQNPFTGFDPDDDMPLRSLRIGRGASPAPPKPAVPPKPAPAPTPVAAKQKAGASAKKPKPSQPEKPRPMRAARAFADRIRTRAAALREKIRGGPNPAAAVGEAGERYLGPQLIINASLNLVAGDELAWQDRRAESFILTPNYCGSKGTGYARTGAETARELSLGRSMSISGAAVDSNVGIQQSSALIVLMTVFNARLGWWMQNPRARGWAATSPSVAKPLLMELAGQTRADWDYVHISDGGHFENLAVYELIRRRCRYIVCCDAGTDPGASDDNLATLIRLCRIDFGVRIEIDTACFAREGTDGNNRWHCAVGKIRYDDVERGELPGLFILLRTTLTGDEPPDIQEYKAKNPSFPWDSTLDQSYSEAQFESYRALGFHVAQSAFKDALDELQDIEPLWSNTDPEIEFRRGNQRLFSAVRRRWAPSPVNQNSSFLHAARSWSQLQEVLMRERGLLGLSREMYPDAFALLGQQAGREGDAAADDASPTGPISEVHAAALMIQVMENAWVDLHLSGFRDLPMNRGWMTVFRRWSSMPALRRHWPIVRGEFGVDFVRFCEAHLPLGAVAGAVEKRIMDAAEPGAFHRILGELDAEFAREWPAQPGLVAWYEAAQKSWPGWTGTREPAFLIYQVPKGMSDPRASPGWKGGRAPGREDGLATSPDKVACGVVFASKVGPEVGSKPAVFEIVIWLRRAYRGMGIASRCARDLVLDIRNMARGTPPKCVTIQTRYPRDPEAMGEEMEYVLWQNFFSHYDFKPVAVAREDRRPEDEGYILLRRTFNPKEVEM